MTFTSEAIYFLIPQLPRRQDTHVNDIVSSQTSLMALQKAYFSSVVRVKITTLSVSGLSLAWVGWNVELNTDTSTDQSIKTDVYMGFTAATLGSRPLYNNSSLLRDKKWEAIKSTLNFSTRLDVKLWDNCCDLINKRDGINSWPCMGEWENKTLI